jgi:hypothetical protein
LLVTADVSTSPILVTLMMEAIRSSETSVLTRDAWRNISEDGILQSPNMFNRVQRSGIASNKLRRSDDSLLVALDSAHAL